MSSKPSGTREQNAVGEWLENAAKVRTRNRNSFFEVRQLVDVVFN